MKQQSEQRQRPQTFDRRHINKRIEAKPEAIGLTNKANHLYTPFNLFQLKVNRLASLPEFEVLAAEIISFNKELQTWKKSNVEIMNAFVTFHLYQNLFSRMKSISSSVINRSEAKRSLAQIVRWFLQEKPKIRNKIPEKEKGQLQPQTTDRSGQEEINGLLTSTQIKRDMSVYETMSRTTHANFFPPKERLLDYKRKSPPKERNEETYTQRRALSVSNLAKIQRYRGSFASTMATVKRTLPTAEKKEEQRFQLFVRPFEIKEAKQIEKQAALETKPEEIGDEQISQLQKEKKVIQQILLQQNIVQVMHEEDVQDEEEIVFEQDKAPNQYKKYKQDPSADKVMIAQEEIKDVKQSTLRRILKLKEEAMSNNMQELSIADKMLNWAATKSRLNSQDNRISERKLLANRYSHMGFIPKTFEQRQSARKRDIPEYPLLYRSTSSQSLTIERQVQKQKITSSLKKYGKYIKHVEIKPVSLSSKQKQDQFRSLRATSLTSFCRPAKRSPFSRIIELNGVKKHNEDALDSVTHLKQRLAKRAISVSKKSLLNAFEVVDVSKLSQKKAFPQQKKLLSNPFFPKHLFTTKSKKKKK